MSDTAAFVPIAPNPYIVGNPVRDRRMFFGREAEFALVRQRVHASERGSLLVFCGERRSGKTSILVQIVEGRLGEDVLPVLIDMQSMAVHSEAEFLRRVATTICEDVGFDPVDGPDASSSPASTLFDLVRAILGARPGKKLVLLIDEYELFEDKIEAGTISVDVLHVLAALMEKASVFLVFTGSEPIEDRPHEEWAILGKSEYRQISFLQPRDAERLVVEPLRGEIELAPGIVERILAISAGQAYYTQGICQRVIDTLNEERTRIVDASILATVVEQLVETPFPQMLFLWDGLPADDRIVLGLLAESLDDAEDTRSVDQLVSHHRREGYTSELTRARFTASLESLCGIDLLRRAVSAEPAYRFRMDLWRLWVARMHTPWQIHRELGLPLGTRRRPWIRVLAGLLVVVLGATWWMARPDPSPVDSGPSDVITARIASARVRLSVVPDHSRILVDGDVAGIGSLDRVLTTGEHDVLVRAADHADSTFDISLVEGDTLEARISLRPRRGQLRVEATPSHARVWIDGQPYGRTPLEQSGLSAARRYAVEVTAEHHETWSSLVKVPGDSLYVLRIDLVPRIGTLAVISEPTGAAIFVDGNEIGTTPVFSDLNFGPHTIRAMSPLHVPVDSVVQILFPDQRLRFDLVALPPARLQIRGNYSADILVDGVYVERGLYSTGILELTPGEHSVEVLRAGTEPRRRSFVIGSAEFLVYDFGTDDVTRSKFEGD